MFYNALYRTLKDLRILGIYKLQKIAASHAEDADLVVHDKERDKNLIDGEKSKFFRQTTKDPKDNQRKRSNMLQLDKIRFTSSLEYDDSDSESHSITSSNVHSGSRKSKNRGGSSSRSRSRAMLNDFTDGYHRSKYDVN